MAPSRRAVLEAIWDEPQTTRELIARFEAGSETSNARLVEYQCVLLAHEGWIARMPDSTGREVVWTPMEEGCPVEDVDPDLSDGPVADLIHAVYEIDLSPEYAIPPDVDDEEDLEFLVRCGDLRRLREAAIELGMW